MCTQIFCWNIRGLNILSHRSGFKKWSKGCKLIFGGLIETHVKQPKVQKFVNGLLPGWSFENNYGFSDLGKIWVVWHQSVKVVVIDKSLQMITCEVLLPNSQDWCVISVVYASNDDRLRLDLWKEIVDVASTAKLQGMPWLMMGDFNQTLHPSEHSCPRTLSVDRRTRSFRTCLLNADLSDLTYKGSTYTWWNKSKTRPIAKKLDRVLVNELWSLKYPASYALFGEPDFSDHASCGVVFDLEINRVKAIQILQFPSA